MSTLTALVIASIAITIFIIYNAIMIHIFGMPSSLSNTYYYLNKKWSGAGWAFTIMMLVVAGMLMVPWISINAGISYWSHYLGFLPFLTCCCIIFVGFAPNFRTEDVVCGMHMWSAKLAAVFALLWVCVCCWKIMYILPIWVLVCGGIAHLTKTADSGRDWWLEMCAFGPTFTAIITEGIMQVI